MIRDHLEGVNQALALSRRFSTALPALALFAGLSALAAPAAAEVSLLIQDRDVTRMISLGGSCHRCELSGRNLAGATFTGASFISATLVGADLRGAELVGSNFSFSDFSRANMTGAALQGSNFSAAVFRDVNMSGAEAQKMDEKITAILKS